MNSYALQSSLSPNGLAGTHALSMITKLYDRAFDLPAEQFANIRNRYEWLRKTELYRNGRMKKTFEKRQCLDRLEEEMSSMTRIVHAMKVDLSFPRDQVPKTRIP